MFGMVDLIIAFFILFITSSCNTGLPDFPELHPKFVASTTQALPCSTKDGKLSCDEKKPMSLEQLVEHYCMPPADGAAIRKWKKEVEDHYTCVKKD